MPCLVIFFCLTEAPLPDPETDPNGPEADRNGPEMDRNQALSDWGWDGRGVCRDGGGVGVVREFFKRKSLAMSLNGPSSSKHVNSCNDCCEGFVPFALHKQ